MVCLGYNNIFGEIVKKNLLGDNDAIFYSVLVGT